MPGRKLMNKREKKERLSVPVTSQQRAVLQDVAHRSDVSLARVLQEAIKQFTDRYANRELPLFEALPPPKG
jgi:hypothetical protein